ncbi:hypothetical protein DFJ63DRAFT_118656 [Scheffersomyces coipomensis]|uniref:uncharacterized protein n=1 Tax=Scheffersomyces coipomensis TaxID=1788519 RepID=UPI00315DEF85
MGKLKRNRKNNKSRQNPLGSNPKSAKENGDGKKDESTRQSKILPLLNKLQSSIPNDRSMALAAITVLCEDSRMRKMLLKEKLVSIIMEQCLNDSNDEIVVESFGLLRNIGIEEGYDVLKHYWRSGIWTSIEGALGKIEKSFQYLIENHTNKNDKSKVQLLYDFTENILSLIVTLSEGSTDLFESVFDKIDPVLTLVIKLLNQREFKFSNAMFNSLLEFIYELSTESIDFIQKINAIPEFNIDATAQYVESKDSFNRLTKIYLIGIKFNNLEIEQTQRVINKSLVSEEILLTIFNLIIEIDLDELKETLQSINQPDNSQQPIQKGEGSSTVMETELTKDQDVKKQLKVDLSSLEISLDLITSIIEYLSINEENIEEPITLSNGLLEILLNKIYPSLVELINFELDNEFILSLIEKLLVSLINLSWLMLSNENLPIEWFEKSLQLWDLTVKISSKTEDKNLQKNCLNMFWSLTKALGPQVQPKIQDGMIEELLNKCNSIVKNQQEKEQQSNADDDWEFLLSSVGFLGNLAPIIGNTEKTFKISEFLLATIEILTSGTIKKDNEGLSIEIVNESINLIFDIFGDKDFEYDNEIFVQQNYLQRLTSIERKFKEFTKKIDKNKYPSSKAKGTETLMNLGRFIQYKASEY